VLLVCNYCIDNVWFRVWRLLDVPHDLGNTHHRELVARMEGSADSTDGIYSIGAVARMLGVPAQTLRAWEERYQQIVPARSGGGQRLYSRDQVDQLSFIRNQIEQGLQPADAHRLLAQQHSDVASIPVEPRRSPLPSVDAATTVLLAERDPYAAEFAEYFLRTEGYVVRIVLDPAAADEILRDDPPSVLVVDLLIGGGAGLTLCRTARDNGSVPVLAVSAVDSRDQALAVGAEAFLVKPLDPLQFVSTVRDLVGTSAYLRPRN
jgi:DNA-binding transcriptional MerR regulator